MNIPADKANHAVYGSACGLAGAFIGATVGVPLWWAVLLAATIVALGKELHDWITGRGVCDPMDAIATILGAVPCAAVSVLGGA